MLQDVDTFLYQLFLDLNDFIMCTSLVLVLYVYGVLFCLLVLLITFL